MNSCPNVIPGRVEFSLDLRAEFDDDRDDVLRLLFEAAEAIAERRGLRFEPHPPAGVIADRAS